MFMESSIDLQAVPGLIKTLIAQYKGKIWITGQSGTGKSTLVHILNKFGIKSFDLDKAGFRDSNDMWLIDIDAIPADVQVIAGTCDGFSKGNGRIPNDIRICNTLGVDYVVWLAAVPPFWQVSAFAKAVEFATKTADTTVSGGCAIQVQRSSAVSRRLLRASMSDDEVRSLDRLNQAEFGDPSGKMLATTVDRLYRREVPVVTVPMGVLELVHRKIPIVGWAYSRVMMETYRAVYSGGELLVLCTASKKNGMRLGALYSHLEEEGYPIHTISIAGLQGSARAVTSFFAELEKPILERIRWGGPVSRHVPSLIRVLGLPSVPAKWTGV